MKISCRNYLNLDILIALNSKFKRRYVTEQNFFTFFFIVNFQPYFCVYTSEPVVWDIDSQVATMALENCLQYDLLCGTTCLLLLFSKSQSTPTWDTANLHYIYTNIWRWTGIFYNTHIFLLSFNVCIGF